MINQELEISAPELNGLVSNISISNWPDIIKGWRKRFPDDKSNDVEIMSHFNLCPIPLFSQYSLTAIQLFNQVGLQNLSYPQFVELPAFYVSTMQLIQGEVNKYQVSPDDN